MDSEWFDVATTNRGVTSEATATAREASVRPTSLRVVETVAQKRGVDPVTLEPLYEAIDPDSLDALFPREPEHFEAGEPSITFEFAGHRVSIDGERAIEVTELEEREQGRVSDADGADETAQPTD